MNTYRKMGLVILAIVIAAQPVAVFAVNIGYVDLQKVFLSYSETQNAKENFEKKQGELKKEFEKRQQKIEKAKKKGKSQKDIQKLIEKMEKELEPKQKELVELNNKLMGTIRKDILKSAKSIAKQYGVDVVLDSQVVLDGGFDLTDFVIEKLNK